MSPGAAKLLELLFVIALVGGWGAYDLWSLRRDRAHEDLRRDGAREDPRRDRARSDPAGDRGAAARRESVTDREDSAAS